MPIKPRDLPDQKTLFDKFYYHEGSLFYKERPRWSFRSTQQMHEWNKKFANTKAAGVKQEPDGLCYCRVSIGGKTYLEHRLIYKMLTGSDPEFIDHINGDGIDNRIENLRSVTHSENLANSKQTSKGKTGIKGVSPSYKGFRARITINGKSVDLGTFKTVEEAKHAYEIAALQRNGEYARSLNGVDLWRAGWNAALEAAAKISNKPEEILALKPTKL